MKISRTNIVTKRVFTITFCVVLLVCIISSPVIDLIHEVMVSIEEEMSVALAVEHAQEDPSTVQPETGIEDDASTSSSINDGTHASSSDDIKTYIPDFPVEWMSEAWKTFEYVDKKREQVATPQALDTSYNRLAHGFLVRIDEGKLYINADKELRSRQWKNALESTKSPPEVLCPILEMLCNRKFDKNIDFLFNFADEPVGTYNNTPFPAFSWVKSNLNSDLLVPYPLSYRGIAREKPQNCDFTEEIESSWSSKKNIGIWRGATTGTTEFTVENWRDQWRPKLVSNCNANPDICDAKISGYVQARPEAVVQMRQELGGESQMSMDTQHQYKYAIMLDGNSAPSSRMLANLGSLSLIVKQESPFIEFFYPSLRAYYHYVPLSRSVEDVKYAVEWARQHDDEVKDMIASAKNFACKHLNKDTIENYVEYLFKEYAARFEGIRSTIPTEKLTLISLEEGQHRVCPGFQSDSCPLLLGTYASV